MIVYATDETYKELVKDGAVMVDFFGKTCVPCKTIAGIIEDLDDEFPFVKFVKADIDDCPQTADEFKVDGIPDMYFYKDGKVVSHEVGAVPEDIVKENLAKILYK